jgi:hypothetical protein
VTALPGPNWQSFDDPFGTRNETDDALVAMGEAACEKFLPALWQDELNESRWHWRLWAGDEQRPAPGDWRPHAAPTRILAGRRLGMTRTGAECVRAIARTDPKRRDRAHRSVTR